MVWLRTLSLVAFWAALSALAEWLLGDPAGWVLFSVSVSSVLLWRSWRMQRVSHWAHHPETSPPLGVGAWDDILAPLYRHLRVRARDLADTRDAMQSMLAAAQALPDGVVTLNEDFQIDWCNRMARRHLGLRLPADRGSNLLNLLRSPEFVAYAHSNDWPEPILLRLTQNGQERVMMIQLTSYASDQRLLISRDVTQIEKLETTRRDFVANVSHELRTPLTVLSGFLETLRDMPADALPAAQRDQYVGMMHEQAQRMQAIVEDLLTLSTLESSPSADPVAVDMTEMLQKAREQIEALSGGRHTFEWHLDGNLHLLGSSSELASAVANLLTNAVRYTPDGGRITVRWEQDEEGSARYSVQDTGIGIPARHIPRLTERFYRVDRGRSRAVGGTGLGLAITKHIAMRHDAALHIESEPGKGSLFSLRFPAERVARNG
ncbi:phosphate regulon sensor protein [Bordetella ansorpii]|uniref:Phosphate regulon sensor protein PhoR n=1 Tax=Bordetella ansorpii TaxID=288768 RepID=A0A157SBG0_9BORD|nr:phosphate regulon sensor histidine kinase PhoR [Bordetella ansorpii]SAI67768.1 phosphate regulon sensor protein [Bordetella ansorpii]